jgi:hypothetical protein
MKISGMSLVWAGSISLDSTFKCPLFLQKTCTRLREGAEEVAAAVAVAADGTMTTMAAAAVMAAAVGMAMTAAAVAVAAVVVVIRIGMPQTLNQDVSCHHFSTFACDWFMYVYSMYTVQYSTL